MLLCKSQIVFVCLLLFFCFCFVFCFFVFFWGGGGWGSDQVQRFEILSGLFLVQTFCKAYQQRKKGRDKRGKRSLGYTGLEQADLRLHWAYNQVVPFAISGPNKVLAYKEKTQIIHRLR